jgi:hypothetical protein
MLGLTNEVIAEKLGVTPKAIEEVLAYPVIARYILDTQIEIRLKRAAVTSIDGIQATLDQLDGKFDGSTKIPEIVDALKNYTNAMVETIRRIPGWCDAGAKRGRPPKSTPGIDVIDAAAEADLQKRREAA